MNRAVGLAGLLACVALLWWAGLSNGGPATGPAAAADDKAGMDASDVAAESPRETTGLDASKSAAPREGLGTTTAWSGHRTERAAVAAAIHQDAMQADIPEAELEAVYAAHPELFAHPYELSRERVRYVARLLRAKAAVREAFS